MKKGNVKIVKITHMSTIGLALFFMLTPFEYPLADLISLSPLRLVGLATMAFAVIDICKKRAMKIDFRFTFIFMWILYGFITILWAIDSARFNSFYSIYLNNALMFLLITLVDFSEYEISVLKKSYVYGVVALLLYMTFIPNAVIYSAYQHRLTLNAGTGGLDQNYLAALMLIAFAIAFYNLCNEKQNKISKFFSILFCITVMYYIILTGSRSGLIATVLIMVLSLNTSWKTRFMVGIPLLLFMVFILPLLAEYLPKDLLERFTLSALTGQEGESGTRLIIWKRALGSLSGLRWLIGYGIGASQTIVGNALGMGKDMAIHNHYIAMLVESGVIGFGLINFPIYKMLKKLWNKNKDVVIGFMGIAVIAFFIDVVTTKFFWSAMILLSVMCKKEKRNI